MTCPLRSTTSNPSHAEAGGDVGDEELAEGIDVRRAVSRLPTQERVLLHLRYREDLEQNRIAELLDTLEGTIKVRRYRAREQLRAHLTDESEANHPPK